LRQNARFAKPWERDWFKARNILLVCRQRQKYNLVVSENALSTYKSAIYIEKQQQVSAGVILLLLFIIIIIIIII
jgi:hypothetical protein